MATLCLHFPTGKTERRIRVPASGCCLQAQRGNPWKPLQRGRAESEGQARRRCEASGSAILNRDSVVGLILPFSSPASPCALQINRVLPTWWRWGSSLSLFRPQQTQESKMPEDLLFRLSVLLSDGELQQSHVHFSTTPWYLWRNPTALKAGRAKCGWHCTDHLFGLLAREQCELIVHYGSLFSSLSHHTI